MTDKVSAAVRSQMMARVPNRNTHPEIAVRKVLHAAGYRYRLHAKGLPGTPDVVLPRYQTAIFVHGCFWHGHDCSRGKRPSSNTTFWHGKLDQNIDRDRTRRAALEAAGWVVVVIWECDIVAGTKRLVASLEAARQERRRSSASELTR